MGGDSRRNSADHLWQCRFCAQCQGALPFFGFHFLPIVSARPIMLKTPPKLVKFLIWQLKQSHMWVSQGIFSFCFTFSMSCETLLGFHTFYSLGWKKSLKSDYCSALPSSLTNMKPAIQRTLSKKSIFHLSVCCLPIPIYLHTYLYGIHIYMKETLKTIFRDWKSVTGLAKHETFLDLVFNSGHDLKSHWGPPWGCDISLTEYGCL